MSPPTTAGGSPSSPTSSRADAPRLVPCPAGVTEDLQDSGPTVSQLRGAAWVLGFGAVVAWLFLAIELGRAHPWDTATGFALAAGVACSVFAATCAVLVAMKSVEARLQPQRGGADLLQTDGREHGVDQRLPLRRRPLELEGELHQPGALHRAVLVEAYAVPDRPGQVVERRPVDRDRRRDGGLRVPRAVLHRQARGERVARAGIDRDVAVLDVLPHVARAGEDDLLGQAVVVVEALRCASREGEQVDLPPRRRLDRGRAGRRAGRGGGGGRVGDRRGRAPTSAARQHGGGQPDDEEMRHTSGHSDGSRQASWTTSTPRSRVTSRPRPGGAGAGRTLPISAPSSGLPDS